MAERAETASSWPPPPSWECDAAGSSTVVTRVTAVEPNVVTVFFAALVTALATGLGALPLIFVRSAGRFVLGASNAIAAGVMLAASVSLCREGVDRSLSRTAVGVVLGICFVLVTERYLAHDHGHTLGSLKGEDARRALLIVGVMTVHSAAEGIGIGAAFADGSTLGLLITIAIAVHNIPEGLAISLVLVPRGTSVTAAAGWSIFSSLPQAVLAVPAFLFVDKFKSILPIGLGFAAGAMVWMVLGELLPEALETASARVVALAGGTAFALMLGFQLLLL
jgi:zinc transporter ZupT